MKLLFKIESCSNFKFVVPEEGEPVFLYIEPNRHFKKPIVSVNNILNQKMGLVSTMYGRSVWIEKMLLSGRPTLATIAFISKNQNLYLIEVDCFDNNWNS
jgi:hypothetical protein